MAVVLKQRLKGAHLGGGALEPARKTNGFFATPPSKSRVKSAGPLMVVNLMGGESTAKGTDFDLNEDAIYLRGKADVQRWKRPVAGKVRIKGAWSNEGKGDGIKVASSRWRKRF